MPAVPCRLCKENVGTNRVRGWYICSQCHHVYENLVHVARVQPDNPYIKRALQRADKILDEHTSLGALTSYAAEHWRNENEEDSQGEG
jgi:hypothetical protein